jgi:hypothetical protein
MGPVGGDGGANQGRRVDAAAMTGGGWRDGGADLGLRVDAVSTVGGGWRRRGKAVKVVAAAGGLSLNELC